MCAMIRGLLFGLLPLLGLLLPGGCVTERRFSDLKRCADEECSMLLCRGKAATDFTGPDCRFLSFKKAETIYVYYKLSGQRSDVWAGSVGSNFGYFPKDLLIINHIYTEKEVEVPTEETDFVCFDSGADQFDSYDLDVLLREENQSGSSAVVQNENTLKSLELNADKESVVSKREIHGERDDEESNVEQTLDEDLPDEAAAPSSGTSESEKVTQTDSLSESRTTFGTTFDAVTTEDEETRRVTSSDDPLDEQSNNSASQEGDQLAEGMKETPLISFIEKLPDGKDNSHNVLDLGKEQFSWDDLRTDFMDLAQDGRREAKEAIDLHEEVVSPREEERVEEATGSHKEEEVEEVVSSQRNEEEKKVLGSYREEEVVVGSHKEEEEEEEVVGSQNEEEEDVGSRKEEEEEEKAVRSRREEKVVGSHKEEEEMEEEEEDKVVGSRREEEIKEDKVVGSRKEEEEIEEEKVVGSRKEEEEEIEEEKVVGSHKEEEEMEDKVLGSHKEEEEEEMEDKVLGSHKEEEEMEDKVLGSRKEEEEIEEEKVVGSRKEMEEMEDKVLGSRREKEEMEEEKVVGSRGEKEKVVGSRKKEEEENVVGSSRVEEEEEEEMEEEKVVGSRREEEEEEKKVVGSRREKEEMEKVVGSRRVEKEEEMEDEEKVVGSRKEEMEEEKNVASRKKEMEEEKKVVDSNKEMEELEEQVRRLLEEERVEIEGSHKRQEEESGAVGSPKDTQLPGKTFLNSLKDKFKEEEQEDVEFQSDAHHEKLTLNHTEKILHQGEEKISKMPLPETPDEPEFQSDAPTLSGKKNQAAVISQNAAASHPKPSDPLKHPPVQSETPEEPPTSEEDPDVYEESEDLEELEDENALLASRTGLATSDVITPKEQEENQTDANESEYETKPPLNDSNPTPTEQTSQTAGESSGKTEPEYSDSVMRLSLLRGHFSDRDMERLLRHLTLKNLFRVETLFLDLERELKAAARVSTEDVDPTLEDLLDRLENVIMDEIDQMLDDRQRRTLELGRPLDSAMLEEEATVLDDFQEFAFSLRQKYTEGVSVSLKESQSPLVTGSTIVREESESLPTEATDSEKNEVPAVKGEADQSPGLDVDLHDGDDGGHFDTSDDVQTMPKDADASRQPQAILEKPLDVPTVSEMESNSELLESPSSSSSKVETEEWSASILDSLLLSSEILTDFTQILIGALPEEWQPGPTFHGLPWKPVVATAVVGILTVLVFFWKTILAVKSRTYLLTETQLAARIQQLVNEKSAVLQKISEMEDLIKQHEKKAIDSEKSQHSTQKELNDLKTCYQKLCTHKENLSVNLSNLSQNVADKQKENTTLSEKIRHMHEEIEKHTVTLKMFDLERAKFRVHVDEAKLREDALKAQVLSFEKDNNALKEQKNKMLHEARDWKEKHEKLGEEIKVFHKTQKELEDSLVHKENEIDVLSGCIAELQSLETSEDSELHKSDTKGANGDGAERKVDPIKLRLKQMMDVSRIEATLSVIEQERNRCFENLLLEQKNRQELEEQYQKVLHEQTKLKNEKSHLENQLSNLQQRLEITTELYQQKENALQQKLTQEELERREKESKLSEVDGKASQAEEELKTLRQKVKDVQDEMQQSEKALKAEIAVQEKKAHENWLKARASERALIEERRESANLRQKIVECSDKMSDLEHSLLKSGAPAHPGPPVRRGESFGPSPVSLGAPSPPLMIEGPGRPPSAPVGRRNESFGPRPPSDPRRFSDIGHPSRPEAFAPRTSSPCTQDGSVCKSQNQESFLPSPIRDSPGTSMNLPPKPYGLPNPSGPLPPLSNGLLPPMMRPPNGHPPAGLPFGSDPRFRMPLIDPSRPPPALRPFGPLPPRFECGLPSRDLAAMGPRPPFAMHDFPPDYPGPFPPRGFPPGPMPPPGAMGAPPYALRGHEPPMSMPPRDGREMPPSTGAPHQQNPASSDVSKS